MRKAAWLPASRDVAILSAMVKKLVVLAVSSHGPPTSVVISYPALLGLCQEDITDTGLYLNLPVLPGAHHYPPREMVAAYAGHSMGLCKTFHDMKKCRTEGQELPVSRVLLVEYTEAALLLHTAIMSKATDLAYDNIEIAVTFELGSKEGREAVIREFVLQFLRRRLYNGSTDATSRIKVIMTGSLDDRSNGDVRKAVEAAVMDMGWTAEIFASLPEFIAARGAAELAWRCLAPIV